MFQFTISTAYLCPCSRVAALCGRTWGPVLRLLWQEVMGSISYLRKPQTSALCFDQNLGDHWEKQILQVGSAPWCRVLLIRHSSMDPAHLWETDMQICGSPFQIWVTAKKKNQQPQRFQRSNFPRLQLEITTLIMVLVHEDTVVPCTVYPPQVREFSHRDFTVFNLRYDGMCDWTGDLGRRKDSIRMCYHGSPAMTDPIQGQHRN